MMIRTRHKKCKFCVKVFLFISVTLFYSFSTLFTTRNEQTFVESKNRHLLSFESKSLNCSKPAIDDFPRDGLTRVERRQGWIILHIIATLYCFALLACICEEFFVPSVKRLCKELNLSDDVTGATFMAVASSSPELFINSVSTFVTEGDIGLGAIVGSAVFNILFVPGCCAIVTKQILQFELWPTTRDSLMYAISIILVFLIVRDGKVEFYESAILIMTYFFYLFVMVFNKNIRNMLTKLFKLLRGRRKYVEIENEAHPLLGLNRKNGISNHFDYEITLKDCEDFEESTEIWNWPSQYSTKGKIWWLISWPILFILRLSIPDCRKHPRMYAITFIMCVLWIGAASYTSAWLITIIGDTFGIPDSVMGLTFLAAGTSVPEAVASIIVTNQGYGAMGLSSVIGSNTFDILICLGLPWMIKTLIKSSKKGIKQYIRIKSAGLPYTVISLLSTLSFLYITLLANKLRLNWKIGVIFVFVYIGFLILASLLELNFFFSVSLPTCFH